MELLSPVLCFEVMKTILVLDNGLKLFNVLHLVVNMSVRNVSTKFGFENMSGNPLRLKNILISTIEIVITLYGRCTRVKTLKN